MLKEHWGQAFFWYINWTSQSIVSNNCFDIHMIGLKVCFDSLLKNESCTLMSFSLSFLDKCDWCRGDPEWTEHTKGGQWDSSFIRCLLAGVNTEDGDAVCTRASSDSCHNCGTLCMSPWCIARTNTQPGLLVNDFWCFNWANIIVDSNHGNLGDSVENKQPEGWRNCLIIVTLLSFICRCGTEFCNYYPIFDCKKNIV